MNNMLPSGTSSSRLDRAIDRAVRDMVQADPRPGFRRRVLARLDPEPVRSSLLWRLAAAGGALAVLVLIVMVAAPDRHSKMPTRADQHEAAAAQPSIPSTTPKPQLNAAESRPEVQPPVHMLRGRARLTSEPIRMPHVANVFGNRSGSAGAASVDADALWPSAPADVPQDHTDGLAPLVVPPLDPPAPILIPPLTPRGPGLND
jgi:hypothetical protein